MKSFIAGCGRSGTTLIRDLMGCFEDTYVYTEGAYGEAPFSSFSKIFCPESNVVIKRTGECWRTLASLPDDIGLIYCVRHPFDVLTSTHPLTKHLRRFHITFDRWTMEYDAWHTLRKKQPNPKVFILKYEELIAEPDVVQTQNCQNTSTLPSLILLVKTEQEFGYFQTRSKSGKRTRYFLNT